MKFLAAFLSLAVASSASIRGQYNVDDHRDLQVADVELLRSINWADVPTVSFKPFCSQCYYLDFNITDAGTAVGRGDYVSTEWQQMGVTISASGGYTPDNKPRIFDTSNPGTNNWNGDPDLGSPNNQCANPGPGVGSGGKPTQRGENCIEGVGNVLIVQESNKQYPDDNAGGGAITFTFDEPSMLADIGVMDIDESQQVFIITKENGEMKVVTYEGFGNNGVQRVIVNEFQVKRVEVYFPGSGAVIDINFCPDCSGPMFGAGR